LVQDACSPSLNSPCVLGLVEARGEDKRSEVRVCLAQVLYELDTLPVGQREVHDGQVGVAIGHHEASLGDGSCLRHHLEVWLLVEDERERLPERRVVLDEQETLHFLPST